MKTVLQMMRMAFWMLPIQRVLLIVGIIFSLGAWMSGSRAALIGSMLLVFWLPLLTGGVFLRKLAAPRHALLWPHSRERLLFGTIGTMVVAGLVLHAAQVPLVVLFIFWTQCTIGLFLASRKPGWALLALGAWLLPGIVMSKFGSEGAPLQLMGTSGLIAALLVWIAFAYWFLTARRIADTGWLLREGVVAVNPQTEKEPETRELAMQRWLLNSGTPFSVGLQWGLAAVVLVGVQLAIPRLLDGDSPPHTKAAMMFGTLSLSAAAIGAVSLSIAKRSRWLWLTAGKSRLELFGWCERLMLKMVLAVMLPLALLAIALWLTLEPRPAMPPLYLALSLVAPVLAAGWFGLMQVYRRIALDGLAALIVLAGWYFGLILPLFRGQENPRWEIIFAQLAFIVLLREVAYVRWRAADWPRVQLKASFD
jgi:hypothetical protein